MNGNKDITSIYIYIYVCVCVQNIYLLGLENQNISVLKAKNILCSIPELKRTCDLVLFQLTLDHEGLLAENMSLRAHCPCMGSRTRN